VVDKFDAVATTALIFYTKSKNAFSGLYFVFNKILILNSRRRILTRYA
jgi:hypothetical protein